MTLGLLGALDSAESEGDEDRPSSSPDERPESSAESDLSDLSKEDASPPVTVEMDRSKDLSAVSTSIGREARAAACTFCTRLASAFLLASSDEPLLDVLDEVSEVDTDSSPEFDLVPVLPLSRFVSPWLCRLRKLRLAVITVRTGMTDESVEVYDETATKWPNFQTYLLELCNESSSET